MSKNDYVTQKELDAAYKPMDNHIQYLRTYISQSDTIPCKDFRLCGVEVFESIYHSNDSIEVKKQNLAYLEELYAKENPDSEDMDELMRIFRERLGDMENGTN